MTKSDFSRTLFTTTINCARITIDENRKPVVTDLEPIVVYGKKLTEKEIAKEVKTEYGTNNVTMLSYDEKEEVRGMSIETFIKHSNVIERPLSQKKEKETK